MLNDIVNSIKATLYDRASSPLFGAFAVSWSAWNFRLITVLLSDGAYETKLRYIEWSLYPTWQHWVLHGVAVPLGLAALYLFAYPYPSRWVYSYHLAQQKKLKDVRQQIESEELLTAEESRNLRQRYLAMQIEFDRQIKASQEERDAAQRVAADLTERIGSHASEVATKDKELAALRAALAESEKVDRSIEARQMRAPDHAKQRTLNFIASETATREQLENTLWRLVFRFSPRQGVTKQNSKLVHLLDGGQIGEGKNANEHTWRLTPSGEIEFVQEDGRVHSRFRRKGREQWIAEADPSVLMKTEMQILMPED